MIMDRARDCIVITGKNPESRAQFGQGVGLRGTPVDLLANALGDRSSVRTASEPAAIASRQPRRPRGSQFRHPRGFEDEGHVMIGVGHNDRLRLARLSDIREGHSSIVGLIKS